MRDEGRPRRRRRPPPLRPSLTGDSEPGPGSYRIVAAPQPQGSASASSLPPPHATKASHKTTLRKPASQPPGLSPRNPSSLRKPALAADEFRSPSRPAPPVGRPSPLPWPRPRLRPQAPPRPPRAGEDPPQTCGCAERCDPAGWRRLHAGAVRASLSRS